jgi:hypothetical protein
VRLTINDDQISYSLEHEKTLGEVVQGIRQWLAAAGFHVTQMRADNRDLIHEEPRDWSAMAVDSVGQLSVQAHHTGDMRIEHWQTVQTWLVMLAREMADASTQNMPPRGMPPGGMPPGAAAEAAAAIKAASEPLQELLANLPETIAGFKANPFLPRTSNASERFSALFSGQPAAGIRSWPAERLREASMVIDEIRVSLASRIADATHPQDALRRSALRIRTLLGSLSEVSVLLQTGRDKAAMEIVIGFSDAVQELLDLMPFLPPDADRGRLIGELTPFLRELVSAFDMKDTVMIGDLLEYEISPRMERLAPLLEGA